MDWLPEGKTAAVCFSIDDVHPATSGDGYEAGGDLSTGALGYLERLLERHPRLKATLFVTPDWRPVQLVRARLLARVPLLRKHVYHIDLHAAGRYRIDRFPEFVRYLNELPRTDVAPHGLHHVHRGPELAVEFQNQSRRRCRAMLRKARQLFHAAGLAYVKGFAPPGWSLPVALSAALEDEGFAFVCSARDIRTPISPLARNEMSGLLGISLLYPQRVPGLELVSLPTNVQATSALRRAHDIITCHGLVSIKAHVFKHGGGFTLVDGLDANYCESLDRLFADLHRRYGERLWWPSLREIADRMAKRHGEPMVNRSNCDLHHAMD